MEFDGQTVLVTGAASGIGHATALAFAEAGATLVLADLTDAGYVAQKIEAAGGSAAAVTCDVSDAASVDALFSGIPRLDAVANCAGILLEGTITEMSPEAFDRPDFIYLSAGSTAVLDDRPDFTAGTHVVKYRVPSFPMVAGAYCVRVSIFDSNGRLVLSGETLKTFTVVPLPGEAKHPPLRTLHLPTAWDINSVEYVENKS